MKTLQEFLAEGTEEVLEALVDQYGVANIIDGFTDALGFMAEEIGDKNPVKADKLDKLSDHSMWEQIKKFAPRGGQNASTAQLPAKIFGMMKKDGAYSVLDDLSDICRGKAEHLISNWDDEESAGIWEQLADKLDKAATLIPK